MKKSREQLKEYLIRRHLDGILDLFKETPDLETLKRIYIFSCADLRDIKNEILNENPYFR